MLSRVAVCAPDYVPAIASLDEWKKEAQAAMDLFARKDTAAAQDHQTRAQLALARAARQFESAGAARSSDIEILRKYGEVRMRLQDYDLAADLYKRIASIDPRDSQAWLLYGKALSELGSSRAADAIAALNKTIELNADPTTVAAAYNHLGRVYRNERMFDLAKAQFEKAITADPALASAKIALAAEKIRDGNVTQAAADLDQLGQVPPEVAMSIPKTVADGLEGFSFYRRTFADTAENHMAYAKLMFRANRPMDGLAAAERSASLDPGNYAAWNFIGDINSQTGNTARAREAYQKSLAIKPEQPVTQQALQSLNQQKPTS
jgi:tetratricopeptide (TPR) repeat protein